MLPLGIVVGSLGQLLINGSGLRDLRFRFSTAWRHPAVRRIGVLYIPIALGLIVTQFQIIVDGRWASATGEQSVSWMSYATTLIQLPLGLVPVAVSLAALPSLSQFAAERDWDGLSRHFRPGPAPGHRSADPRNGRLVGHGRARDPAAVPARQLHERKTRR